MEFEVASVKPVPYELQHKPNFPLDNSNAFAPGDRFSATSAVWAYISFAYKLPPYERRTARAHLPAWVNDYESGLFAIDARAAGNPSKDQIRLMMQSLLADRFKLVVHYETRQVTVFALRLVKPGQTGPKLRPHSKGPPCPDPRSDQAAGHLRPSDEFPPDCQVVALELNGVNERLGGRNITMPVLAEAIAGSYGVDKPVVDQTGLNGQYDFTVEYTGEDVTEPLKSGAPLGVPQGTSFLEAVREQLGLKLVPSKAPVRMIVIDHLERPSEN